MADYKSRDMPALLRLIRTNLKQRLLAQGMTIAKLASETEIARETMTRLLNPGSKPNRKTIEKVLTALGLNELAAVTRVDGQRDRGDLASVEPCVDEMSLFATLSPSMRVQFPPPRNPEDFDILCKSLYERVWPVSSVQLNGRSGQAVVVNSFETDVSRDY